MSDLQSLTTPKRLDVDRFQAEIPDGWQQGRGAFGGLVIANLVRAIEAFDAAPERVLRSLTAECCGPVPPGPCTIRVERLRTGSGVSTIAARIEAEGEALAHAVGVLAKKRSDDTDFCHLPAPTPMPPWRSVPVIPVAAPIGPVFAENFEYRVSGPPPFSGGAEAIASGWIRPRNPGAARDAAYLTACIDAWWPAIAARLSSPRPIATLTFTLELIGSLAGLDPEAPLYHASKSIAARDGYTLETRELWGEDGRLVARNHQTMAVIK
ncbi:TesB-like acyl-CoA thioesterase 1 [Minicystis rosea]|nr:TesB-like acyl-CoA thioesterase 1 [Minicystis rosea]